MELSKSNHYELEYSLNTLNAYVNSKTGRLNIVFSEFSKNLGNLKIAWNLVYNSQLQYCDDVNKIDNHFTHSLNTYILPYQTSYNLEGFETGDYIFVDSNSDIHNFKYYKTVNSEPYYYDTYGSGLVLRKTSVNYILEDLNQNKYFYDLNGRRINMRSGINSNIYKVINRNSSGRITNIYDNRKYNSKINFAYQYNKLISIDDSFNTLKFSYDSSRLKCVFEYKQSKYRKLYSFEYNENNEL